MKTMKRILVMFTFVILIMFTFVNCEKNDDTCLYHIDIYQQDININLEGDTISCSDIYISYTYDTICIYEPSYDELKKHYITTTKNKIIETETYKYNLWFVLSGIECH